MKTYRMLILCAAIAVPQFISAEDAPPSALNSRTLGQIEAIIDYCVNISPAMAKAKGTATPSISKASKKELDEARNSDDYKEAYDSTTAALNEVPQGRVLEACNATMPQKQAK